MNFHLAPWHIWIITGIILFIIEIFTPSFVAGSVGIGAIFGGIIAAIGLDINWQLITFAVFTAISFFAIRPIVIKLTKKNHIVTNAQALIGRTGKVIQPIGENPGYVKIDGDNWRSFSIDNQEIPEGTLVEVIKLEGITIFVKPKN